MNFPRTPLPLVLQKRAMSTGEIVAIVFAVLFIMAFLLMVYNCATTSPTPSYCLRG